MKTLTVLLALSFSISSFAGERHIRNCASIVSEGMSKKDVRKFEKATRKAARQAKKHK